MQAVELTLINKRDRTADLCGAHAAHPPKADLLYCKRSAVRLYCAAKQKRGLLSSFFRGGDKRDRTADLCGAHAAHPPKADLLYCKRSAVRLYCAAKQKRGLLSSFFRGGDKRDRTADLLNAIQALSQVKRLRTPQNSGERIDMCMKIKLFEPVVLICSNNLELTVLLYCHNNNHYLLHLAVFLIEARSITTPDDIAIPIEPVIAVHLTFFIGCARNPSD